MHLRIGAIRRHIGGGVELDVVVITLDAQTVARYRVAVVQQAGGDGLMALGGAVHLEVPQENLQLPLRGGDSADFDGGNAVLNVHIALLGYLVTAWNLLGGDFVGVDLVLVGRDFHSVGVAHLLIGYHIHKLDSDVLGGFRSIDGVEGQITFLLVFVPAPGIVYQLGQFAVRKGIAVIRSLARSVERPAGDLLVAIVRGRSSRCILLDRLHSDNRGQGFRVTEADLDRPTELRRSFLIIGLIVVVRILSPDSVDSNVVCSESHKAFQKCETGRSLCCRRGRCISIILQTPSKKSDALIGCIQFRAFIQDSLGTCIVLVGIGNRTSCPVDIIG